MVNETDKVMRGIASRAIYFATPLAFAAHPAVAKSGMLGVPTIAGPAVGEAGSIRAYSIVDGPPVVRFDGGKSLGAAISEEVRRRMIEWPDGAPETPSSTGAIRLTDFTIAEDGDVADSGNVMDAVIAAHAERIAVLKQRMDALRSDRSDADRLADLRVRLYRAEAARRLAVARVNVEKLASVKCGGNTDCRPAPAVALTVPIARATASPRRAVASAPSRRGLRQNAVTAKVVDVVSYNRFAFAAKSKPRVSARAAIGERSRSIVVDLHVAQRNPFATRLAHARRSLDTARTLLTGVERVSRTSAKPILHTAGLWRWPGSETWSLTSARSRTV